MISGKELSTQELVKRVVESGLSARYEDAVEVVHRGVEALQYLKKYVREDVYWGYSVADGYACISSLHLLSAIADISSLDDFVYVLYNKEEELGDWLTEDMPSLLSSFGPKGYEKLKQLSLDRKQLDISVRIVCLRAVVSIAKRNKELLEDCKSFLRSLVKDDEEDKSFRAGVVWLIAEMKDREFLPYIKEAFRKNVVDKTILSYDDVLEIYSSGSPAEEEKNPLDYFKEDNLKYLKELQQESEEKTLPSIDEFMDYVKIPSVGRNEPCICGSGKKYKKCCLQLHNQRKRWEQVEDKLRGSFKEFYNSDRFSLELEYAKKQFGISIEGLSDERLFYDWYLHDYPIGSANQSLINLYIKESEMDEFSLKTLKGWADSSFRLVEVTAIRRFAGIYVRDLFSSKEYFIHDVSSTLQLYPYDLLLVRPYPIGDIVRVAGGLITIPRVLYESVKNYVESESMRAGMSVDDFLRKNSLSLIKYLYNLHEETLPVTPEGDMLSFSECTYRVSSSREAARLLNNSNDFKLVEEAKDELVYNWIAKGEFEESSETDKNEKRLLSYLVESDSKGKERYDEMLPVLGEVRLHNEELTINCISDQRLQRCKAIIEKLLGGIIVEKGQDRHEEFESVNEEEYDEEEREFLKNYLKNYYAKWVDTKIPMLGGMTPREASRTDEGREKLEEALKLLENIEARNMKIEDKDREELTEGLRAMLGLQKK